MIYFLLSISFLLNPYLLIILNTFTNFKTNKIYFSFLVLLLFIFTNLRTYDNFLFAQTGDDSGDYIIGSKIISSGFSILDVLLGRADKYLNHIDRVFALIQLFLSKIIKSYKKWWRAEKSRNHCKEALKTSKLCLSPVKSKKMKKNLRMTRRSLTSRMSY